MWAVSNNVPLSGLQQSSNNGHPTFKLEDIPYGRMYITMVQIDSLYGDIWENFDLVDDVLSPQSASDAKEAALWIQSLLQSIYTKVHSNNLEGDGVTDLLTLTLIVLPRPPQVQPSHKAVDIMGCFEQYSSLRVGQSARCAAIPLQDHGREMDLCSYEFLSPRAIID